MDACAAELALAFPELVLTADEIAVCKRMQRAVGSSPFSTSPAAHPSTRQMRHPDGRFRASLFRRATPRRAKLGGRFF